MYIELIGTLVGLVYLWLEYRASIYLWIASIVMPAIYIFVYYDAGLYADCGINVYYLGAALYGWAVWRYGAKGSEQSEYPITHIPTRHILAATTVCAVALVAIAWLLMRYTDSDVPWCDAFTTALSIIGMWMLARKYKALKCEFLLAFSSKPCYNLNKSTGRQTLRHRTVPCVP